MPNDQKRPAFEERELQLDGANLPIRFELQNSIGINVSCPMGTFPVRRLAIGRDDAGLYVHVFNDFDGQHDPKGGRPQNG
jgi:hypothetical protein